MAGPGDKGDARVIALDEDAGGDQPGIARPVSEAEMDDILNDPALSPEERRGRLETLAGALGEQEAVERGGEFTPLGAQIDEALSLLAGGGHDYGSAGTDLDSRSDARSPGDDDLPPR